MAWSAFCSRNKYLTQSPYKGKVNFDTVYQVSVSDGGFGSRDIDVYLSRSPGTHYVERAGLTLQDPSAS